MVAQVGQFYSDEVGQYYSGANIYPSSRVRKSIDRIGDARLLARISEIDGLEELARLVTTMQMVGARLRLRSPAPHLVFNISAVPRAARFREVQRSEALNSDWYV